MKNSKTDANRKTNANDANDKRPRNPAIRFALATLIDCAARSIRCECGVQKQSQAEWATGIRHSDDAPLPTCECPINGADLVDAVVSEIEHLDDVLQKKDGAGE